MSSIVGFIALKSCNNLHFPDFFLITKIGVFQGLLEGSIWPAASCSITNPQLPVTFQLLMAIAPLIPGHQISRY